MTLRIPINWFGRHLLFWVLVWGGFLVLEEGIPLLVFGKSPTDVSTHWVRNWITFMWVQLPIMLVYSYCATYILLPFALKRQYGRLLMGLLSTVILTWFLFGVFRLSYLLIPSFIHQPATLGYEPIKQIIVAKFFMLDFIASPFFRINIVAGMMVGTKLFNQWWQKQQENQRLERKKLQTELKLLKLQINPGFLFGSLDRLHQLTQNQDKQAPEVVLKLAYFLRYVLYDSQTDVVSLMREIDIIEQYVFLQQIMHSMDLEVSFTVRGNPDNQTIVPLLLFSIVERAFRQLPAEPRTGEPAWVSIDLAVTETHLTLKVINGQTIDQPDDAAWLVDVQKQLYFYYAERFDLHVRSEVDTHIVSLTLPLSLVLQPDLTLTKPLPEKGLTTSTTRLT